MIASLHYLAKLITIQCFYVSRIIILSKERERCNGVSRIPFRSSYFTLAVLSRLLPLICILPLV